MESDVKEHIGHAAPLGNPNVSPDPPMKYLSKILNKTTEGASFFTSGREEKSNAAARRPLEAIFAAGILFGLLLLSEANAQTYWTESGTGTIKVYRDGEVETLVSGLSNPSGIAVDSVSGKLYWTDRGVNDVIQRSDIDGANLETLVPSGNIDAFGIALDVPGGKMYWADSAFDVIRRANLDGSGVEDFIHTGGDPESVALDLRDGKIYWSTFIGREVFVADLDGSNIQRLMGYEDGLGLLEGIAINQNANKIYLCDFSHGIIYQSNLDGSGLEPLITGLSQPIGVAFDAAADKIRWVDQGLNVLQESDPDGGNISTLQNTPIPKGLAIPLSDPVPKILVVDSLTNRLIEVDYNTGAQVEIEVQGHLNGPMEIVTAPDGRIFIANTWRNEILEYSPQNHSLRVLANHGFLNEPVGIDFDSSGNLIVANRAGHSIVSIERDLGEQALLVQFDNAVIPYDVAVDGEGDFLVTTGQDSLIKVNGTDGSFIVLASGGLLKSTIDVVVLREGRILVSDWDKHSIVEIDPADGTQEVVAEGFHLVKPSSLTEARDGSLLVADDFGGIVSIDLSAAPGDAQTLISENGLFNTPSGATLTYGLPQTGYFAKFKEDSLTLVEGSYLNIDLLTNYKFDVYDAEPGDLQFELITDDPELAGEINFEEQRRIFPGDTHPSIYLGSGNYDRELDGIRTFRLRMTSLTPGLFVGPNEIITITIEDNDVAGAVFFSGDRKVLHEGQPFSPITLSRNANDPGSLSVRVRTVNGSALAGRDFQPFDTLVTFPLGSYSQEIDLALAPETAEAKPVREFTLELHAPSQGGSVDSPGTFKVIVNDKDDPGSIDSSFALSRSLYGSYPDVLKILSDGRIMASLSQNGTSSGDLFRLDRNGTIDATFKYTRPSTSSSISAFAEAPDGKFLIGGSLLNDNRDIIRLNNNGSVDGSFTCPLDSPFAAGRPGVILPLPDGKILIAGQLSCVPGKGYVARLNPDGSPDTTFHSANVVMAQCASIGMIWNLPDGKILLAGHINTYDGHPGPVVRLFPDGTVDTSFVAGIPPGALSSMEVQPDGRILLGYYGSNYSPKIRRLLADGALDTGFNAAVTQNLSTVIRAIRCLPNGKILIAGRIKQTSPESFDSIIRLNADGTRDDGFRTMNYNQSILITGIATDVDGAVYVGGNFNFIDEFPARGIARLIQPDVFSPGSITVDRPRYFANESSDSITVSVTRTGSGVGTVGAYYRTVFNGSADGSDITPVHGSLVFAPGEFHKSIVIPLVGDVSVEGPENFDLVLFGFTGGILPGDQIISTITMNDAPLSYADWRAFFYSSVTSPEGAPDYRPGDGSVANLMHYAFETDPTIAGSQSDRLPEGLLEQLENDPEGEDYFAISFFHSRLRTGVRVDVESSLTLDGWESIWNSEEDPEMQSPLVSKGFVGDNGWITIRDVQSVDGKKIGFLRIQVSENP